MKSTILIASLLLASPALFGADASAKDDVINAAQKLAAAPNYSWKSTVEIAGGGGGNRMRPGPTEGRTQKDGLTQLTMTRGENTTEAFLNGQQGAIKTADGWKSLAEVTADAGNGGGGGGGQANPGRFLGRMLQTYKLPAAEAEDLAGKTKELTKTADTFSGDLTEAGAKELLSRGPRRPGADAPATSNAKGTVKFWVKDGVLAKYELHVQGTVSINGNDRDVDRTTTVEIKDVGTTKVEAPEDAKKKLS
jgi:hypothetical protein